MEGDVDVDVEGDVDEDEDADVFASSIKSRSICSRFLFRVRHNPKIC